MNATQMLAAGLWLATLRVVQAAEPMFPTEHVVWTSPGKSAADVFPPVRPDFVCWHHRNENAFAFEETVRVQALEPIRQTLKDSLLHRTIGSWITGVGLRSTDDRTLVTPRPVKSFDLRVASPCEQTATAEAWLDLARDAAQRSAHGKAALKRTMKSWAACWDRSSAPHAAAACG